MKIPHALPNLIGSLERRIMRITMTDNAKGLALISRGYRILAEYQLVQEQLKNIYAVPSYTTGLRWFGVIFVHSGIYAGGVFRFTILLPENFPDDTSLPKVIFATAILHPFICPHTKTLDLGPGFKRWLKDQHHIWHLLRYIQAIFADPENSLSTDDELADMVSNMEALNMLANSRPEYMKLAQEQAIASRQQMYDRPETEDPHYIVMEPYCADRHGRFMEQLKSASWWEATCLDDSMPSEYLGNIDSSKQLDEKELDVKKRKKLRKGQKG